MRVNRFTTVIACSVGVAVIALPVLASGPDGTWSDLSLPGTLYRPSAIYDPVRERMVVVATSIPGSVWGLSTSQAPSWEAISTGGLPTQQGGTVVYDSARERLLLFGGYRGGPSNEDSSYSNHTWQLPLSGPAIWTPVDDGIGPLPPPRMYHAAIYDAVHDRMMVFSGVGGGSGIASFKNDVWALSLSPTIVWQRIGGDLPCGEREWASAIDDPVRDRMIIYGGYGFGDRSLAWALSLGDPMNWIPLGASGPIPATRDQHAAVYDPVGDRMLLFGGRPSELTSSYLNDVWGLSLGSFPGWVELAPVGTPPIGRAGSACVVDATHDRLIIYGGSAGSSLSDLWTLALSEVPQWSEIRRPESRSGHTAVADPHRRRMLIFGGTGQGNLNDVWSCSLVGPAVWEPLVPAGVSPSPRTDHAAVFDPLRDRMLVFGGSGAGYLADLWSFSVPGGVPTWQHLVPAGTGPSGRAGHSMVYDSRHDRILLFGGIGNTGRMNDVWELTLGGPLQWNPIIAGGTPPSARWAHTAVYDAVRDRMVVFGGLATAPLHDCWSLDLAGGPSWALMNQFTILPSARYRHVAVIDPIADRMIVVGGQSASSPPKDVWELGLSPGSDWRQLAPAGWPDRFRFNDSAIYDPTGDRMLIFGSFFEQLTWDRSPLSVPSLPTTALGLEGAWPNPTTGGSVFASFSLPDAQPARLEILDVSGRRLLSRQVGSLGAGHHVLPLARPHVAPGVYWLRLTGSTGAASTRRIVID
jgi:hypothetical protein